VDRRAPGGGIGLMSMRERVEAVGGVLEVQPAPPSGTRVRVTVPTADPEPSAAMATA
jgi:signal transduction histidine kinase